MRAHLAENREAKVEGLEKQIYHAVESGVLDEPFNAAMIRAACPGLPDRIYHVFLAEHAVGNGSASEFV